MKKTLFVAAAALIDENDNVLMVKRANDNKRRPGEWEYPGGKVEEGETPEEALKREIKEEINIDINIEDIKPLTFFSHNYPNFHLFLPLWEVRKWQGEPLLLEGQEEIKFINKNELDNYNSLESSYFFSDFLKNYLP